MKYGKKEFSEGGGRVSNEFCSYTGTIVAQKNTNRNMNRFARKITFDLNYGYFSSLGSEISIMEPFGFLLILLA